MAASVEVLANPVHITMPQSVKFCLVPIILAVTSCTLLSQLTEGPVEWKTVYQSQNSTLQSPEQVVMTDDHHWSLMWEKYVDPAPSRKRVPAVDFSKKMLAMIAMGGRGNGCYSVSVRQVYRTGDAITVEYQENAPGLRSFCTYGVTAHVLVIEIPRSEKKVKFVSLGEVKAF